MATLDALPETCNKTRLVRLAGIYNMSQNPADDYAEVTGFIEQAPPPLKEAIKNATTDAWNWWITPNVVYEHFGVITRTEAQDNITLYAVNELAVWCEHPSAETATIDAETARAFHSICGCIRRGAGHSQYNV